MGMTTRPYGQAHRPTCLIDHSVALASALRLVAVSHGLWDVLCATASLEGSFGSASLPGICIRLGCTFQGAAKQLERNADLFVIEQNPTGPRKIKLSLEAIAVMTKVINRSKSHEHRGPNPLPNETRAPAVC